MIAWMDVEKSSEYNPQSSSAVSIRNPAIRYLHRLLTSTLLCRRNAGKVQSANLYLIAAAVKGHAMNIGCFLAEQFQTQAALSGNPICIGGMITPIALHFGVEPTEDPISREIVLDMRALTLMKFICVQRSRIFWKLTEREGDRMFELPNEPLTRLSYTGVPVIANYLMNTHDHVVATRPNVPRGERARGGRRGEGDARTERIEEKAAYEQDGSSRGFHM